MYLQVLKYHMHVEGEIMYKLINISESIPAEELRLFPS